MNPFLSLLTTLRRNPNKVTHVSLRVSMKKKVSTHLKPNCENDHKHIYCF